MSVKVLSAVVVLLFCAGCASPAWSGPCECMPLDYDTSRSAALAYVLKHYPQQTVGLSFHGRNEGWLIEDTKYVA